MLYTSNIKFNYEKEPSRDILCIDCKSFYASVECVERNLDPLKAKLVVMSNPSNDPSLRGSGLVLASSPMAKKEFGITNVSRARDLPFPYPNDLYIVSPRMSLYFRKNLEINNIYRKYVDSKNHSVFSVDETFLDVTDSLALFGCATAYELARIIQTDVYKCTGIYTTVGIGDNPILAKIALDLYAKSNFDMKSEIRYTDVPSKLWVIDDLTKICGIGTRMAKNLNKLGINNVYDLAHANFYALKSNLGIIGTQLFAYSWGIDRSFLGQKYKPKSKSISTSQTLTRDYTRRDEIENAIREIADNIASKLRKGNLKTEFLSLWIGYSFGYIDHAGKSSFHQHLRVPLTNSSKDISSHLLSIFSKNYVGQDVRRIGVSCDKLVQTSSFQLSLFEEPDQQLNDLKIDYVVDTIRKRYGFDSIVHGTSLLTGATAISRSHKIGGHSDGLSEEGESRV